MNTTTRIFGLIGGLATALLLAAGCGTTGTQPSATTTAPTRQPAATTTVGKPNMQRNAQITLEQIKALSPDAIYGKYLDLSTNEMIDFDTMMKRLKGTQVIFVSEVHTHPGSMKLELNVLTYLHDHNPKTALGMEFLHRASQPLIDDYISGAITQQEFDRKGSFGFGTFYPAYKNLLEYARENKIKTFGLNVSQKIRDELRDDGWNSLEPEEQKLIAKDLDLTDPLHQRLVKAELKQAGHGGNRQMEDRFYMGMTIWDETFGEAVANYVKSVNDKTAQVMVVAGKTHINFKVGTPERYAKRCKAPYKTIVPVMIDSATGRIDHRTVLVDSDDIDIAKLLDHDSLESRIGDFVYFVRPM
jgi:uncharacterized iron-regulated protein